VTAVAPTRRSRKALGAWYTPAALVERLLDLALDPAIEAARGSVDPRGALLALRVLDPSCGEGAFLVPAASRIINALERVGEAHAAREVVERCVVGVDVDARAAGACADALREIAPGASPRMIVADALRDGPGCVGDARFDVVVGNPPYLNQLARETASSREVAAKVRGWSGGLVKGYADAAAAFWLLSTNLLREGGRCALVLPRSILSTRDASAVRAHIAGRCAVDAIWFDDAPVFDAGVRVCAPVVRLGKPRREVAREISLAFRPISSESTPRGEFWRGLIPGVAEIPDCPVRTDRVIGDMAQATADFRDQYYGLAGSILEDAQARGSCAPEEVESRYPRIITSGLIDRDTSLWGERPTRILKQQWLAPRVDRERLERDSALGAWLRARLVPKILLATQTRVLEPLLDIRGEWLPCVPVITITPAPNDPHPLDTLLAVHRSLLSPISTAFAAREFAGAALSPDALKLSAKQARALPLVTENDEPSPELLDWFARRLTR
jgi:tRNA1(Val) A37 N6-methylase TrmN6